MYKNKFKILILFFLVSSIPVIFANNCVYEVNNDSCQRFTSSFIKFNLVFNPNDILEDYSAEIYKKENPSNKIKTRIEGNTIYNVNPLTEVGVYVLKVSTNSIAGITEDYEEEFIFDNSQAFPPIIKMGLSSEEIKGNTLFGNTEVFTEVMGTDSKANIKSDSNGNFTINLNLPNEINLVRFYTKNSNEINSEYIERVIYKNGVLERKYNQNPTSINIDSNLQNTNYNTIYDSTNNEYITSKRNFYVSGTAEGSDGVIIYINGIEVPIKNKKFGGLVILNEGENLIEVSSLDSSIKKIVKVTYILPKFVFEELHYDKITSSSNLEVSGKANLDLPFNVYLNGKYLNKIPISNGDFSFTIANLKPGKNYLTFEGYNNNLISDIIYYDSENPEIQVLSKSDITNKVKFIFKVTDDIGIDLNSIKVDIGSNSFTSENMEHFGDYYSINLDGIEDGEYNYNINIKDLTGKEADSAGQIKIDSENTLIESIETENGFFFGNNLFIKSSTPNLVIYPSENIAFKSIYLDGVRQTNYRINIDGSINLNLDLVDNSQGIIEFKFINKNYQEFTETYNYFTDKDKPTLDLDYINFPYTFGDNRIKISGEIIDSNFNWSSLSFNGDSSFQRFGKYFEAQVLPNEGISNLRIDGGDFLGNSFSNDLFGSIIFKDSTDTTLENLGPSNNGFIFALNNIDERTKNFVYSWDGQKSYKTYLNSQEVILPVSDREGIRSINLKGFESSRKTFNDISAYSIDYTKPEIYFVKDSNNNYEFIIDSRASLIKEVSFKKDGIEMDFSNCQDKLSIMSECYESTNFSEGNIQIMVEDFAGNINEKTFSQNQAVDKSSLLSSTNQNPTIYFNGNDLKVSTTNGFIEGNIKTSNLIKSVKVEGKDCLFDANSFVCYVDLPYVSNTFNVEVETENSLTTSKTITINRTDISDIFNLRILGITSENIFKLGDDYYVKGFEGILNANIDKEAIITLLIDNNRILSGTHNGSFDLNIDLSNQLANKDEDEFDIQLEARNENGDSSLSNKIKLIYNRVLDTLLHIVVY